MRSGTIALLLGVVLLQQHAELPHPAWVFTLIPLLLLRWHRSWLRLPLLLLAGYCWALLHAHATLLHTLPQDLEGKDVQIRGEVISLPEVRRDGGARGTDASAQPRYRLRFLFRVDEILHNGVPVSDMRLPLKIRLGWYATSEVVRAGEYWQLLVRLKQPNGFMNPGGFDYEGWLFLQGIRASGYVRTHALNRPLQPASCILCLNRMRQQVSVHLDRVLENNAQRGVIKALITGERGGITPAQWQLLANTGTNHLLAISGLHIGLVAGLVYWLTRWLWSFSHRCTLLIPAQRLAAVAAIVAALAYAALAGFSIPTRRAFIMVLVAMAGTLLGRATSSSHLLALALSAVLILDPASVLSIGFWLSFGAVASILYGMCARVGNSGLWWKWGRAQWLVFIGLLPLMLICFQRLPLLSPLANLIAVPLVSLLVVPMLLLASVCMLLSDRLAGILFVVVQYQLEIVWGLLRGLGSLPFTVWTQSINSGWTLVAAVIGVLVLLAPAGFPRKLGVVFILPLLLYRPAAPAAGEVWLTVLDVGQGLALVVQTRNHAMLYDSGPRYSAHFDAGDAVVVPFLGSQGIARLDRVVVSHSNLDHSGGLAAILAAVPVTRLLTGEPLSPRAATLAGHPAGDHAQLPAHAACVTGQSWHWDGVGFEVLHPPAHYAGDHNSHSCTIRISTSGGAILLTGDIDEQVERQLLQRHGDALAATVLVVPHHGSNSSSSPGFIARVDPQHAIISSGYRNRFDHPRKEVVSRYHRHGAVITNTSIHGAVRYRIGASGAISGPEPYRLQARRYWNRWISQKSSFYPTVR